MLKGGALKQPYPQKESLLYPPLPDTWMQFEIKRLMNSLNLDNRPRNKIIQLFSVVEIIVFTIKLGKYASL